MLFRVLQFVAHVAPFLGSSSFGVAEDLRAVALEELSLVAGDDEDDARAKSACIFAAWTSKETAGWNPAAVGDFDSPNGPSFGVGQMKAGYFALVSVDFAAARKDRRESMRAAWRFMRHEIDRCGSVASGLGAVASGKCGGAPALVRRRLQLSTRC